MPFSTRQVALQKALTGQDPGTEQALIDDIQEALGDASNLVVDAQEASSDATSAATDAQDAATDAQDAAYGSGIIGYVERGGVDTSFQPVYSAKTYASRAEQAAEAARSGADIAAVPPVRYDADRQEFTLEGQYVDVESDLRASEGLVDLTWASPGYPVDVYVVLSSAGGGWEILQRVSGQSLTTEYKEDTNQRYRVVALGVPETFVAGGTVDTTPPQVSNLHVSTSEAEATVRFDTSEPLGFVVVRLRDQETDSTVTTLGLSDFTRSADTYTGTYDFGQQTGLFEAALTAAEDVSGNAWTGGTLTDAFEIASAVDTTPPDVTFQVSEHSADEMTIAITSNERLGEIEVRLYEGGAQIGTLMSGDFERTGTGSYVYTAIYAVPSYGTFNVLLFEAEDLAGNSYLETAEDLLEATVTLSEPEDTTPPSVPSGFGATAGAGQVTLTWSDPPEADLDAIRIYRGTQSDSLTEIASVQSGSETYSDTGLTAGQTYYYAVSSVDTSGNESARSGEVSATPTSSGDTTAPTVSAFTFRDAEEPAGERDLLISITADEAPAALTVTIGGPEGTPSVTLDEKDFSPGNTLGTYAAVYTPAVGDDGTYTATLDAYQDAAGNDGAGGETASVTLFAVAADGKESVTVEAGTTVTLTAPALESGHTLSYYEADTGAVVGDGAAPYETSTPPYGIDVTYQDAGAYQIEGRIAAGGTASTNTLTLTVEEAAAEGPAGTSIASGGTLTWTSGTAAPAGTFIASDGTLTWN